MPFNKQLFVNLPVKDLKKSIDFFGALGFSFEPKYTDENATCMIVGKDCYVMLLMEPFFKTFTDKPLSDATRTTEVLVSISAGSRNEVDNLVKKAFELGAKPAKDKYDMEFMYGWSFYDLDGHHWEVFWMNGEPPQK